MTRAMREFRPNPTPVTPPTDAMQPSMPEKDTHNHLAPFGRDLDRFLKTNNKYFSYSPNPGPGQGRWMIYGRHLPQSVLSKIYHDNAARLFQL